MINSSRNLDCLLVFVPKLVNFYKPIGNHMFTVLLPTGLLSVADFINNKGYNVNILHFGLEKINDRSFSLRDYLRITNPKVVGLSLHWHYQCYDTMEVAKEIKRYNPNIFIVLGGLTAGYFHDEILRESNFIDGVIRGDGEVPFYRLVDEISTGSRDFSKVPNFTWREKENIRINPITYITQDTDLDELNFTNFKLLRNYQLYIRMSDARGGRWLKGIKGIILNKLASVSYYPLFIHKGCSVNCSYCGGSKLSQKIICGRNNISIRSVEKVVDSIKEAYEYGFEEIYISYLPFDNRPDYFKQLFEAIKKEKLKMNYFLECWALPPGNLIRAFKDISNNNSKLYIGISPETGSEEIRKFNKGFYYSNNELVEILSITDSLNIPVILYFSVGLPRESIEDINITLHFKDYLRKKFKNILSISTVNPVIEPASPMYFNPDKYQIIKTRNSFKDFILSSKDPNRLGFLTTKLGYFKRDFCASTGIKQSSEEDSLQRYLQKIICKSSCRLSDFLISNFFKTDSTFLKRLISKFSECLCKIISTLGKIS